MTVLRLEVFTDEDGLDADDIGDMIQTRTTYTVDLIEVVEDETRKDAEHHRVNVTIPGEVTADEIVAAVMEIPYVWSAGIVDHSEGCECDHGACPHQTYGEAELPEGAVPVQACDICKTFEGDDEQTADEQAARDYAQRHAGTVGYVEGDRDDDGEQLHGEWFVQF